MPKAEVFAFYEKESSTIQYVVCCPLTRSCAIVDSVLDFEPNSGAVSSRSADKLVEFIKSQSYEVSYILETHVHADHFTASAHLKTKFPSAKTAISQEVCQVQKFFKKVYNIKDEVIPEDGSQFDQLLKEGDELSIGSIKVQVMNTPGHTPACVAYYIKDDCVFCGDTIFMPDQGTARCDFPGGDALLLFQSIERLLSLPPETIVYTCHDYQPGGRPVAWKSTIEEERSKNIHVKQGISSEQFVKLRTERDKILPQPRLIIPVIQVNINAGRFPAPEDNGITYLKLPLNVFGTRKPDPPESSLSSLPVSIIFSITPQLFVGKQLTPEEFKQISTVIKTVINLRSPEETGFMEEEESLVKSLGMFYVNIPTTSASLQERLADEILYRIDDCYRPILIHDSNSKRSIAIALMHVITRGELSLSQARERAKGIGFDASDVEEFIAFLSYYVKRHSSSLVSPGLTKLVEQLWIAPQVDRAMLHRAKQIGIRSIINLRCEDEQGFWKDEEKEVLSLGMTYKHLPVRASYLSDPEKSSSLLASITELINRQLEKPILVHCRRMNRSAAIACLFGSNAGHDAMELLSELELKGSTPSLVPGLTEFVQRNGNYLH